MKASTNNAGLAKAARIELPCFAAIEVFSSDRRCCSQLRCSGGSHAASFGSSASTKRQATPKITAGTPSISSSHCQPATPPSPCSVSSAPEMGEPIMLATGMPTRNAAVARARHWPGNQRVKNR